MKLYYNAGHPVEILQSMCIKSSWCNGRNRGVSMSSQLIDCHGAFTFVFNQDVVWYANFRQVEYGHFEQIDFLHKVDILKDEHEWWSPTNVSFALTDLNSILFRRKSPAACIHPRICKRNATWLAKNFPKLFQY